MFLRVIKAVVAGVRHARCYRLFAALFATITIFPSAGFPQTQTSDPVLAKVNGVEIRQSDLVLADAEIGQNLPPDEIERKRDYLVRYLSDMVLLVDSAKKNRVPEDAAVDRRIAFVKNKVLMERMLESVTKDVVTDTALQRAYEEISKNMATEEEFYVRSILFRNLEPGNISKSEAAEAKAKAVIERAKKGESFMAIANELNEGPTGRETGGDMGYLTRRNMGNQFFDAISKLAIGEVSQPIKNDLGWTIVKLEDRRVRQLPPFEKVRPQLEDFVRGKAQFTLVQKLRADAKIEQAAAPQEAKPQ